MELCNSFSFKSFCLFLFTLLLFIAITIGIITLVVIFVLRPKEPKFSLSRVKIDSYKLNVYSSSNLLLSSIVSLTLNAQNHNKIGIKYSPSWLNLYYQGIPIGLIQVPGFYQPAQSANIEVKTKISLHGVNVTRIITESSLQEKKKKKAVQVKILGDFRVRLILFHLSSPKLKVALECDIDLDFTELPLKNYQLFNMDVIQDHLASFPGKSESFSKKCTLAFYL